jgi:hypothetical protein
VGVLIIGYSIRPLPSKDPQNCLQK